MLKIDKIKFSLKNSCRVIGKLFTASYWITINLSLSLLYLSTQTGVLNLNGCLEHFCWIYYSFVVLVDFYIKCCFFATLHCVYVKLKHDFFFVCFVNKDKFTFLEISPSNFINKKLPRILLVKFVKFICILSWHNEASYPSIFFIISTLF